jgi:putative ABC transport system permease protein
MWWRILKGLIYRNKASFFFVFVSALLGAALVASLISVSLGISSKISNELRKYGANILVKPVEDKYLDEEDIYKLKTAIFWRYNIVGIAPYLYEFASLQIGQESLKVVVAGVWFEKKFLTGEKFVTGLRKMSPYLEVKGSWPTDEAKPEALVGEEIAERLSLNPGDGVKVKFGEKETTLQVVGVMESGGFEDSQVFVPLAFWQDFLTKKGQVSQVFVSAVTVPLDDFGRRNPETMTRREYDKWYCTAYVTSVARQVEEAMEGSVARPIWRVVEAEGKILNQLSMLLYILVFLSLVSAALAVSTTLMSNVLRRRKEVGLLRALGGEPFKVAQVFLLEAGFVGFLAGLFGYGLGYLLSTFLGKTVFGTPFEFSLFLFPLSLVSAVVITLLGSYFPLKEALKVPAGEVMRG